ncbi:MAG: CBS domain-containing protein [Fervidicoccaceae archaeon]
MNRAFESALTVRDIMTVDVKTASPDARVSDVVRIMIENEIGSVVIVGDKREVLGIITERDLIRRVLARGLDPKAVKAEEIMSRPVITIEPDASVEEAANLMKEKGVGHLPVVESGRLVGIIAEGDILMLAPQFLEIVRIRAKRRRRGTL